MTELLQTIAHGCDVWLTIVQMHVVFWDKTQLCQLTRWHFNVQEFSDLSVDKWYIVVL